jgi:hypothetical protein
VSELRKRDVRLVCLAGFMRKFSAVMIEAFPNAVLNIHPSLLPSFPGLHPQQQALDHGVKTSGVTVHFVTADLDAGRSSFNAPCPFVTTIPKRHSRRGSSSRSITRIPRRLRSCSMAVADRRASRGQVDRLPLQCDKRDFWRTVDSHRHVDLFRFRD